MDAFGCVEFEVVKLGNMLYMVQGLLDCGVVAAYQDGVICTGQVKEWCVDVVEGGEEVVGGE